MAITDETLQRLTGEWYPVLPKAYEKSIVLGGGVNLFPIENPQQFETILQEYAVGVAQRAYQAGRRAGKAEIRKAIFE